MENSTPSQTEPLRWKAPVTGSDDDLATAAELFHEGEFTIVGERDGYYLTSDLASVDDVRPKRVLAGEFLALLNGACRAHDPGFVPLSLGNTYFAEYASGERAIQVDLVGTLHVRGDIVLPALVGGDGTEASPPPRRNMALAQMNSAVSQALQLLGSQKMDYLTLRKIYEIIRHDVGGKDRIKQLQWMSEDEFQQFWAMHDPELAGEDALHAHPRRPSKAVRVMSPNEAKHFVSRLTSKWLDWHASSRSPDAGSAEP